MTDVADVVIVGGGIAGASLACGLAREGLGVTVLESTEEYEDRVRGESMQLWGIKEARQLGVESVMLDAGAHIAPVWRQYMEGVGDAGEIPTGIFMDGFAGTLNLRHPVACQALVYAAAAQGVRVLRGVREVKVSAGTAPSVSYRRDADNRGARRAFMAERMAQMDPEIMGMFAGPENVPGELIDEGLLSRIRAAEAPVLWPGAKPPGCERSTL